MFFVVKGRSRQGVGSDFRYDHDLINLRIGIVDHNPKPCQAPLPAFLILPLTFHFLLSAFYFLLSTFCLFLPICENPRTSAAKVFFLCGCPIRRLRVWGFWSFSSFFLLPSAFCFSPSPCALYPF